MCGICGSLEPPNGPPPAPEPLARMIGALRHRGPDEAGAYQDDRIGLGSSRLAILDLKGGRQPIANEDRTLWVVFNGEIFNHRELRSSLERRGHRFATQTDTEVLVHLYEEHGRDLVGHLNGQFAFALWDQRRKALLLARDRFGILPLFYTQPGGSLLFASEVKALLAHGKVSAIPDPRGLAQLFTSWAPHPPRTVFRDVLELPPAHWLWAVDGRVTLQRYWQLDFSPAPGLQPRSMDEAREELAALLTDAVRLRLRADVPVAAFLSGGLDSSAVSALAQQQIGPGLRTFSVGFEDPSYDETRFQREMAAALDTDHQELTCSAADIGRCLPDVVWHAEKPLVRTAPAPLFLLARRVHQAGIKVVLTGEGADEILGGYDLFKEMKIRRFWGRRPDSCWRPALLQRLYPSKAEGPHGAAVNLEAFYRERLAGADRPEYSHIPRWDTTAWIRRFFAEPLREAVQDREPAEEIVADLPPEFLSWDPLSRAQYLEITTLLSGNLLSSQGDRMVMAHGVESRPPFLDHRLVEWCAKLPPRLRLRGLEEKYLLRRAAAPWLPPAILSRRKQAYRAPDSAALVGPAQPDYIYDLLSQERVRRSGCFDAAAVGALVRKCRAGGLTGARENIALVGIVTTLLWHDQFVAGRDRPATKPGPQIAWLNAVESR